MKDAMEATEKKEQIEAAKRAVRDSMYTARYADPNKAKVMAQSLAEAAALTGVSSQITPPPPSPYRLS